MCFLGELGCAGIWYPELDRAQPLFAESVSGFEVVVCGLDGHVYRRR